MVLCSLLVAEVGRLYYGSAAQSSVELLCPAEVSSVTARGPNIDIDGSPPGGSILIDTYIHTYIHRHKMWGFDVPTDVFRRKMTALAGAVPNIWALPTY